jgi:hypothetical protein
VSGLLGDYTTNGSPRAETIRCVVGKWSTLNRLTASSWCLFARRDETRTERRDRSLLALRRGAIASLHLSHTRAQQGGVAKPMSFLFVLDKCAILTEVQTWRRYHSARSSQRCNSVTLTSTSSSVRQRNCAASLRLVRWRMRICKSNKSVNVHGRPP